MWSFVLISFGSFHLRKLGQFVISLYQHGGLRELKEVSKLGLTRGGPLFQEAYVIAAVIANLNRIVQLYGHKKLRVYLVNPTTLFLLSLHPLNVLLTTSWSTGQVNDLQKLFGFIPNGIKEKWYIVQWNKIEKRKRVVRT